MTAALGKVSGPDLQRIQLLRRAALAAGVVLALAGFAVTDSRWRADDPIFYEAIEYAGMLAIFICIAGRTWSTLYIGGRKKGELVTAGPYSMVRNPLYLFTFIGAAGAGAQAGCLVPVAVAAAITTLVFVWVVGREEAFLSEAFPEQFKAYAARVPRFWPKLSMWRDVDELTIRPALVRKTFLDACLFGLSIPLADLIEAAQRAGLLPILLRLP